MSAKQRSAMRAACQLVVESLPEDGEDMGVALGRAVKMEPEGISEPPVWTAAVDVITTIVGDDVVREKPLDSATEDGMYVLTVICAEEIGWLESGVVNDW